ncbi:hypothetical protein JXA02_03360, partial [candidate division KSB1 bacterium]|nr:hypothetical protein [candidate division KSB1 bacterium]
KLQDKLASLALKTVAGEASSKTGRKNSRKTFIFTANDPGFESISFEFGKKLTVLTAQTRDGERVIPCGFGVWEKSRLPVMSMKPEPVAASGAWVAPDHYQVRLCATETPYIQQLDFQFKEDELLFDLKYNVSFGSRAWEQLRAKRK